MLRDWLLGIPYLAQLGYVLVFFGALLETIPAAGLFIPGQTIVVIGGFLAHEGILNAWLVFGLAAGGAILGDWIGFALGRHFGIEYFFRQRGFLKETVSLVHSHPRKTLIFGRFNSLTRAFAPFAAGASGLRTARFLVANIIGGVLWAATWVLLGRLFGASYEFASAALERVLLASIIVAVLAYIAYRYLRKQNLVRRLTTVLLFATVVSVSLFSVLLYFTRKASALVQFDIAAHSWIVAHWYSWLVEVAKLFTLLVHPVAVALVTGGMMGLLWLRHNKRRAIVFAGLVLGAVMLNQLLKTVIMRARPEESLITVSTASFPSGHALLSTVLVLGIMLIYGRYMERKTVWAWSLGSLALLTSLSRLYLGVHWPSDIIAGVAAGVAWTCFVFLCDEALRTYKNNQRERLYHN